MAGVLYGVAQKVDQADKKILKALFQDGRMPVSEIAKKTGLRRDAIARRIKRMLREKIIVGVIPIINPPALGLPNIGMVWLKLKSTTEEEHKRFLHKLVENRYLVYVAKLLGRYDFYCAIVYKDINHLNAIIEEVRSYVPNLVEDYELFQVVDEPKFEKMDDLL
jgi:Lrp/AsnC family leucine-responsive transcriptional regulator